MAISLALALHAHQPAGNFDAVIEQAYATAYRPFLEAAAARPWLKLNLHYSGFLLDWLADHHPDYVARLRHLVEAGRLEMLGGGYYEPILAAIPASDQQAQLERLAAALQRHCGVAPQGAWLAERVWEPELTSVLARAGLRYTLLDDSHFERAGLRPEELHGYWLSEDQGANLALFPSNFFLRQALPFRPEREGLDYLLQAARDHPGSLLTMGDDLEKFGSWPHTFRHVYAEGWLERFFDCLESHRATIETVRLSDYLRVQPARGLVYLPTASYPEMMRWAESSSWRNFLTKYREANLLHKTGWDLHRRLLACDPAAPAVAQAHDHLLAAQCNDVYWHGWFGGLYSPHLRNLAFSHLLAADALLDALAPAASLRHFDLHLDGHEVVELRSPQLRLLVVPDDGGSLEELDYRPANANLINSLQRRPEPYHQDLPGHAAANPAHLPGPASPLSTALAEGDALLQYDPFPRTAARLYLCPPTKTFADFQRLALDPDPDLAAGPYAIAALRPGRLELSRPGVLKSYALTADTLEVTVTLDLTLAGDRQPILELVLNLLAPDAPDRALCSADQRLGLRWAGALGPQPLRLEDGWRQFQILLDAPGASHWWVHPLYSVSQSETGFETLYQGSALAARWPPGTARCAIQVKIFPSLGRF